MNKNVVGISLGNVCYSAVWGVDVGFRKAKKDGYKTCPFDLMISNYKGIIECIRNDFHDFCNPHFLSIEQNINCVKNSKYNFFFNHESPYHADLYIKENWPEGPNHYINNNYKHFIDRYNQRIQNFRNYLQDSNNHIIFIIQFANEEDPNNDFYELREVLKLKYPNLIYNIQLLPKDLK
jgi:hypothetical protein